MARQLPVRSARLEAERRIFELDGYEENADEFPTVIPDDDVSAMVDATGMNETFIEPEEMPVNLDDSVEAAEEWAYFPDEITNEEDFDLPLVHESSELYTARDGTVWSVDRMPVPGRQPIRNVFRERSGFRRGLHPQTRAEAFLVTFETILDSIVSYTNTTERRLAKEKGIIWKNTNREELDAFVGLHIFAGKLILKIHAVIRSIFINNYFFQE